MSAAQIFSLGFLLILTGAVLFAAARLAVAAARAMSRSHAGQGASLAEALSGSDVLAQDEAALVIAPGGRLAQLNPAARLMFNLPEDSLPSLERLARAIRPVEAFYRLCAAEGRARFFIEGRAVQGVSFTVPAPDGARVVLTLRPVEIGSALAGGDTRGISSDVLRTITELTQAMAASLDINQTLEAVLKGVEKLFPADFMEITVWDTDSETLTPYRLTGLPGAERALEQAKERYRATDGYTGFLVRERQPLLVTDVAARRDLAPVFIPTGGLRSYMGVVLQMENDLIGTLELGSLGLHAFSPGDLDLLRLFSGQAAIAIHNAQLYKAEQRRAAELSGLANLAQAFGSLRDPKDLFQRLLKAIEPLVKVEMLGFLLFNENTRTLEAAIPFKGLPEPFTSIYKTTIAAGSEGEQLLIDQDVLITDNAAAEPRLEALGLIHLTQAASMRETALVPLASAGRMLGYLQASNHSEPGAAFTRDELHLLMIIANQAAPIIENATLIQQSRQRAQRAESLRRITSLASSAANLDEILCFSTNELFHLTRASVSFVLLYDEARGELKPHLPSMMGAQPSMLQAAFSGLAAEDAQFPFTVTGSMRPLFTGRLPTEPTLVPAYQRLAEKLMLESAVVVPLVVRDRGVGELWLASTVVGFFDRADLQLIATAGGQLAGVVERTALTAQTDESLRHRVDQLTSLTRINRELSTTLDLTYLLQTVFDESLRTTRASCGAILLFDLLADPNAATRPVLFCTGDLSISDSSGLTALQRQVIETAQPVVLPEFAPGAEAPHGGVGSLLAVPITYQSNAVGLIELHANTTAGFDQTALEIIQALAVQIAVVLGNVLQYQDQLKRGELLKHQVDTLARLFETSQLLRPDQSLEDALGIIAAGIQQTSPFQVVLISVADRDSGLLTRVSHAGLSAADWEELRAHAQPWRSLAQLLQPEFRLSRSYFIPADKVPVVPEDVHTLAVIPGSGHSADSDWDPDDFLLIPLEDNDGNPLGLVSLDAPRDNRRPDRATIELVEVFAAQAGLAIESHLYTDRLQRQADALAADCRRLEQQAAESQVELPRLLEAEARQMAVIQGLEGQSRLMRAGLEVAVVAGQQQDAEGMLAALARELLARLEMDVALVAVNEPAGARLLAVCGDVPAGVNPEALFGQRNPLRQALQDGGLVLVAQAGKEAAAPLLKALEAQAYVCLPVTVEKRVRAAVLVTASHALPEFSREDRRIFEQVARQAAVTLQNASLLAETRRRLQEVNLLLGFSRQLGSLDQASILAAVLESALRAIPMANAGMVALWDANTDQLVPLAARGFIDSDSLLAIAYAGGENRSHGLPLDVFNDGSPRRVDELNFAGDYHLTPEDLLNYRRATGGRLPVSSLLVPIRSGGASLGLLVLDSFTTPAAFSAEDEAMTASLAQQAALALENARLFAASEQRTRQLQALTEVARQVTASLHSQDLIAALLPQLATVVPYDTAALWLREGNQLKLAAASGFDDSDQRLGIRVAVEDSRLFGEMIATSQPLSVGDVRVDPRFPSLMELDHRSWLGIPLVSQGEVTGLVAVEKTEPYFYTPERIQAGTAFASQAIIALEKARLYEESVRRAAELDQRSQRLALLNRLSGELSGSLDFDRLLWVAANELVAALNCSVVSVVTFEDDGAPLLRAEGAAAGEPGLPAAGLPLRLPDAPLFARLRESQGIFHAGDVGAEADLSALDDFLAQRSTRSLLAVPLATASRSLGVLLLQTDHLYRFTLPEIELALTVANQTAIAAQNALLFAETRSLTEDLERRVQQRTTELQREHRNTETLLQVITELSASLDITQVLSRTLAVLNRAVEAEESAIYLARGGPLEPLYRTRRGQGAGVDAQPNRVELEIGKMVTRLRQPVLIEDIAVEERWQSFIAEELPYRSLLVVPLVFGEDVLGVMELFSAAPGCFHSGQVNLVEAAARQIGVALNNAELFNVIRDQSEHLGGMLREQQIEASRSRAILESVADGVLVTDADNKITLFNASGQRILDLSAAQVIGYSLEMFSGLFGKSGRAWLQTINAWTGDPTAGQTGASYLDQITLENGRIVAVSVAPVFLRSQFMGTVSIFRDITAEVRVDRLKSEFVANVSHELRTPMTSIKGYVDIMLMGAAGPLSQQQTHFLEVVRSNTQRLNVLVNDLLDVSRIEAGRVILSVQPLDLTEIAQDVANDILGRSREENKPIAIRVEAQPGLPHVEGDLERISQVITNLVGNAYNYTPDGGEVLIRLHEAGGEVQVDVQDNGIGIALEEQHRIFERFYRGEDPLVLKTAGTGLGLSIVKNLVEMHHGRIWFNSPGAPGLGSTFSFTLPVRQAMESEATV